MKISVDKIIVGERLRQDNGDIAGLGKSIQEHGLLHPVVIDATYNLVAGGRRLLATKEIGYKEIEVRMIGELTEKELRILELEENIKRKDLTEIEKSRNLVELAENKAEALIEKGQKKDKDSFFTEAVKKPGGRPKGAEKPDSLKNIAKEIGVPLMTLHAAKQHVAIVDKYPELESLPKNTTLEVSRALSQIPNKSDQDAYIKHIQKESEEKIEHNHRIGKRVKKLIDSGFGETVTEEELDIYLEQDHKTIDEQLDRINATIKTFEKIKQQLEARKKIRRVK